MSHDCQLCIRFGTDVESWINLISLSTSPETPMPMNSAAPFDFFFTNDCQWTIDFINRLDCHRSNYLVLTSSSPWKFLWLRKVMLCVCFKWVWGVGRKKKDKRKRKRKDAFILGRFELSSYLSLEPVTRAASPGWLFPRFYCTCTPCRQTDKQNYNKILSTWSMTLTWRRAHRHVMIATAVHNLYRMLINQINKPMWSLNFSHPIHLNIHYPWSLPALALHPTRPASIICPAHMIITISTIWEAGKVATSFSTFGYPFTRSIVLRNTHHH